MYTSLRTAMFGFAIISTATTASAVSLSSFTPRIDIQNAQCQAAYATTIDGCTADDFANNARCSSACVQGLVKIGEVVNRVCKDVDVGETSIIGVFQNGIGIQALCPGVSVTTLSSSTVPSTKAPAQTSTQAPASKATTTSAAPPSSTLVTSSSTSKSESARSSSTSSQGLVVGPDATSATKAPPTSVARPPPSSTAGTKPTRAPNAQLSNADSGGGSPFDVQATGDSSRHQGFDLTTAALVATALLFVAFA